MVDGPESLFHQYIKSFILLAITFGPMGIGAKKTLPIRIFVATSSDKILARALA